MAKGLVSAWEGGVVGGEGGSASCKGVAVISVGRASCAFGQGGDDVAIGERLCRLAAPLLRGAACGGRRACSPFDLGCEGCPRARDVPPSEAPERAGEDKGVMLEPSGREAGLWRPPPALGRLLAAELGCAVLLRSRALLTDFLGTSIVARGRALEAARGSPTSAPAPRVRRELAGEGTFGVGPEESGDKAEGQRVIDIPRQVPLTAQEPCSSLPKKRTSPGPCIQGASSGSFWSFSSAHRFLSWEPEPLLPKKTYPGVGGDREYSG